MNLKASTFVVSKAHYLAIVITSALIIQTDHNYSVQYLGMYRVLHMSGWDGEVYSLQLPELPCRSIIIIIISTEH